MEISVSESARNWYLKELKPLENDCIRFFVQYGGHSAVQKGFSLGIRIDTPFNPGLIAKLDPLTFYIEEDDIWYFDNHDMNITLQDNDEYPQINYVNKNGQTLTCQPCES